MVLGSAAIFATSLTSQATVETGTWYQRYDYLSVCIIYQQHVERLCSYTGPLSLTMMFAQAKYLVLLPGTWYLLSDNHQQGVPGSQSTGTWCSFNTTTRNLSIVCPPPVVFLHLHDWYHFIFRVPQNICRS